MLTYLANSQRVSEELRIATEKLNALSPTSLGTVDHKMEIDDAPTATVRVHRKSVWYHGSHYVPAYDIT